VQAKTTKTMRDKLRELHYRFFELNDLIQADIKKYGVVKNHDAYVERNTIKKQIKEIEKQLNK
jgi:hypothetical protein